VSLSSEEAFPTVAEALTAAAWKLLEMPERIKSLE